MILTDEQQKEIAGTMALAEQMLAHCQGRQPTEVMTALTMCIVDTMLYFNFTAQATKDYLHELVRIIEQESASAPVDPEAPYPEALPQATFRAKAEATAGPPQGDREPGDVLPAQHSDAGQE